MNPGKQTTLLQGLPDGEAPVADGLIRLVYDELRILAARRLRHEQPGGTLQPTALVHEVYVRLADQTKAVWKDRAHFIAVAAMFMRRILVDHARQRGSKKRGGRWGPVSLDSSLMAIDISQGIDVLAINDALDRLAKLSERQARVVELRFFGGLSVDETAAILGLSARTVKGDWRVARAWLAEQLG